MKKLLAGLLALMMALALAACGGQATGASTPSEPDAPVASGPAASSEGEPEAPERETVSIMGMKGPTTMGMVRMWSLSDAGETQYDYRFEMVGTPDEIVPRLTGGEVPIAAVPANLASVLYNNTGGKIKVAAINTLGVLYVVETGESVGSIEDLRGKTIYSTGKGTTPEFTLNYILEQNGLVPGVDVTIEYKSEATEVAALLGQSEDAIAVLPQPYVTALQMSNDKVRVALDLNEEWNAVSPDSAIVTGVLVVNTEWLGQNEALFANVLADYSDSIAWVNANTAQAAQLVAQYGIVEKAPVAEKALPYCNITFISGDEMKARLGGYLEVLYGQNPDAVGGRLPDDAFYYGATAAPAAA